MPWWLQDKQYFPHPSQLDTGELIIPVTSHGVETELQTPIARSLQFVLQLQRNTPVAQVSEANGRGSYAISSPRRSSALTKPQIQGWYQEELDSLEIICSQLSLAYNALYWRERLEQSRQQAALIGRISRLLNSSLNPDEIVSRIVAELGAGLNCDRCILVDLRHIPVNILAVWDHPKRSLPVLQQRKSQRGMWQVVIDLFLQGNAAYLEVGLHELRPEGLQDWLGATGAESALLLPLLIQGEFFGTVALLSYHQPRVYLLDELQTVRQVADQAAIALTNARHYQSLWHKKEMLRQQNSSLRQEMLRDELTHLLNRRALEQELEQLSTSAAWIIQPVFSVIVCDIDFFKTINDTHGHLVGDEVLQMIAQQLQHQLRRETPLCRYGGEEFVIILTATPLNQAIEVATRLRQTIASLSIPTKVGPLTLTASFGVAQQNRLRDRTAWDVLNRADQALYEAKRRGRDRVEALPEEF
jgi:diguanylate cyclase (GGDEF)-like protein